MRWRRWSQRQTSGQSAPMFFQDRVPDLQQGTFPENHTTNHLPHANTASSFRSHVRRPQNIRHRQANLPWLPTKQRSRMELPDPQRSVRLLHRSHATKSRIKHHLGPNNFQLHKRRSPQRRENGQFPPRRQRSKLQRFPSTTWQDPRHSWLGR